MTHIHTDGDGVQGHYHASVRERSHHFDAFPNDPCGFQQDFLRVYVEDRCQCLRTLHGVVPTFLPSRRVRLNIRWAVVQWEREGRCANNTWSVIIIIIIDWQSQTILTAVVFPSVSRMCRVSLKLRTKVLSYPVIYYLILSYLILTYLSSIMLTSPVLW